MSQAVATIPEEVAKKIEEAVAPIKGMTKEQLLAECARRGAEFKPDEANEGYLKRRLAKLMRAEILQEAGLSEAVAAPPVSEASAPAAEGGEKKKTGRKKMEKSGTYKIHLNEGQSAGREGSTKYNIVTTLKDKTFSYDEFRTCVGEVMGWEKEEPKKFTKASKFADLDKAAAAWFSELKNKQEIVVPVTGN